MSRRSCPGSSRRTGGGPSAFALPFLAALILAVAALLVRPGPALADAQLIVAEPADGSVLAEPPRLLRLRFNEVVAPLVVRLLAPDGRAVDGVTVSSRNETIDVAPPPGRAGLSGTYALSWRVASGDGHPVGGTIIYSVGAPSAAPVPQTSDTDPLARAALWIDRLAIYVALFVGVGGAAFWTLIGRRAAAEPPGRTIIVLAIAAGLPAACLAVGLQGVDALGGTLASLVEPVVWRAGAATAYGPTAALAILALALGLAGLLISSPIVGRALSLAALMALGVALAASGHASAASPQWLTRPAVFLHAIGIALWIGALLPLAALLSRGGATAGSAIAAFSRLILPVVAGLVLAGLVLAVIQVETPMALLETAYGRVLLIKLSLLVLLFALAAVNRYRLTPAIAAGQAGAEQTFRRTVLAECALVLLVFGAVAAWRFTPPPRALAQAAQAPASIHIHTLPAMVDLTLTPGRARVPVRLSMSLMTGEFGPLEAKEVTITLSSPEMGIEPIERKAARQSDGTWSVDTLIVPQPGRWQVRVDALVSDFDKHILEDAIDVRK